MSDEMNNDFSTALEGALARGDAYQAAYDTAARLVAEFSMTVGEKLPGVTVQLLPRGAVTIGRYGGPVLSGAALTMALNPRPRRIGDDREDKQTSLSIVGCGGSERRILWELELDEGGFPITVLGPTPGESEYCVEEEELRQAFVRAIGAGVVGRKLQVLANSVPAQLPPDVQADDADDPGDAG